jgi:hypothetical protein
MSWTTVKKFFLSVVIVLSCKCITAQGIIAGSWSAGELHVDPLIDTFLNAGGPPLYTIVDDALWDLDGDANADLAVEGFNFVFSPFLQQKSTDVRTLGSIAEIAEYFTDTCWSEPDVNGDTTVAHVKKMVRIFNENDTIGPSAVWVAGEHYWSYYDYNSSSNPDVNCGYISPYENDTGYIGIRYFAGGDTLYGWMKFAEPSTHSIKILEWAFQLSPYFAMENYNHAGFIAYPNPATGSFTIQLPGGIHNSVVEICNSQGKFIMEYAVENHTTIDLSGLPPGFYYIRIQQSHSKAVKLIKL